MRAIPSLVGVALGAMTIAACGSGSSSSSSSASSSGTSGTSGGTSGTSGGTSGTSSGTSGTSSGTDGGNDAGDAGQKSDCSPACGADQICVRPNACSFDAHCVARADVTCPDAGLCSAPGCAGNLNGSNLDCICR